MVTTAHGSTVPATRTRAAVLLIMIQKLAQQMTEQLTKTRLEEYVGRHRNDTLIGKYFPSPAWRTAILDGLLSLQHEGYLKNGPGVVVSEKGEALLGELDFAEEVRNEIP